MTLPLPPSVPGEAPPRGERKATSAALLQLVADNVPVLMAYYRVSDFRCQFANKLYAQTFGWDVDAIIGSTFVEVIGDEVARQIQPRVDQMLRERKSVSYERAHTALDGSSRWLEVNLLPHLEGGDAPESTQEVLGAFVLVSDITRHRLAERAVRDSEERLAKFMQASAEGIVFHKNGIIIDANPALCALMGYTLEEVLGKKTLDFLAPEHVAQVASVIASGQELTYESALIDKHGQRIAVEFIARNMMRRDEEVRMSIVRDIRDRQAAQARIYHLAHHDALTGLPNRWSFMEHVERSIRGAEVRQAQLALLFIDLDHFKRINDSLGHFAGDALLRTVAARIAGCLRATDVVARFGGDEFMVLLSDLAPGDAHATQAEDVAGKLLAAISLPLVVEDRPLSVSPSVGIALYPEHGQSAEALVKHADSAMYLAKAKGRANVQFFDRSVAVAAYAALVMEGQLAQALERGEFALYFQPQVDALDGRLVGAEALIRWNHPEYGWIAADAFIPVAEQRQLMLPIGQWVLAEAARCARQWLREGLAVGTVAVNLSSVQFQSIGFLEAVAQVLLPEGMGEASLELELTERMLMDDVGVVKARLERLRAMGLQISVDDFGTGYSSLGHLKELPIDKVKIDRSFVQDLPGNSNSAAITRAIIQMGRSLGMRVVAEGVETPEQRDFLATQGCHDLQGLLISEPLPQAAFEAWVRARSLSLPPSS